jgi:hypothetical protein
MENMAFSSATLHSYKKVRKVRIYPGDAGDAFLRNVGLLPKYMDLQH